MMATYFNGGSEFQAENLQTLYLMNPGFAATYSDAQLVGVPLAQFGSGTPGVDISGPSSFHEIPNSDSGGPRFHYNLWGAAVNADPSPSQTQTPAALAASEFGFRRPSQQGLSLSLNNSSPANKREVAVLSGGVGGSPTSASGVSVGATASQSVILGSKYLKTVQQLLDEVVNMADTGPGGALREKPKATIVNNEDSATELSSVQRQELQMKKSKLLNMLDEVELRYKQYQIQMQGVAWALEQAAGAGTAKSYTSLALRTISKQFRCLKDAIATQIKESGRRLQEEEDDEKVGANPSYNRLRLVEKQLKQQQAMQQLGMMHNPHLHNVWRPQRGLPERAVSVLRAWLFEHFLHPYPKDSDKLMLAKQTGLTRSQVSNWFINARVRLWKPMVEEMYVEEMKGGDAHRQNDSHNANNTNEDTPKSTPLIHQNPTTPSNSKPNSTLISPASGSSGPTLHTVEPGLSQSMLMPRSPKRQRNSYVDFTSGILSMEMKDEGLFTNHEGGFGPNNYPVSDHIGSRFNLDHHQSRYHRSGSAVSLTLGLPHSENLLSLSGTHHPQQNFLPGRAMQMGRRLEIGVGEPEWCADRPGPHSGAGVGGGGGGGGIDIQTRKTFAAPLLPDFVA